MFHCQQAAEKILKAFLTWHDQPFGKIHNLEELGEACKTIDSPLDPILSRAVLLSKYASRFRYPGASYEPTVEEARDALQLAREVMRAILKRLSDDVQA